MEQIISFGIEQGIMTWQWISILMTVITVAFIASLLGSFTGLGGGMILRPAMQTTFFATSINLANTSSVLSITTNTLITTKSAVAAGNYKKHSKEYNFNYLFFGLISMGLVGGMFLGAGITINFVNSDVSRNILEVIYASFLIISFFLIYFQKEIVYKGLSHKHEWLFDVETIVVGLIMGIIVGIFGVSAAPMKIAMLLIIFNMSFKQAAMYSLLIALISSPMKIVGSSLLLGTGSSFFHLIWTGASSSTVANQAELNFALILASATLIPAVVGAKIGLSKKNKASESQIKYVLLLLIAIYGTQELLLSTMKLSGLLTAENIYTASMILMAIAAFSVFITLTPFWIKHKKADKKLKNYMKAGGMKR